MNDSKIFVSITDKECFDAAQVGLVRRIVSCNKGFADRKKQCNTNWEQDIEGAIGEMVLAKHLNIKWNKGVNTFHDPDVGSFQVRTTQYLNGKLIVRAWDSDDDVYVLVVGTYPKYYICGGIRGKDAKQDKWKLNPNGTGYAWFIPQPSLSSIESMKISK